MEAFLRIKLEGPEIKQFIKLHSGDAAACWWEAKEQRKGGNRQPKKKRNVFRCTNKFIGAFLESSGQEEETKQSDLVNQ